MNGGVEELWNPKDAFMFQFYPLNDQILFMLFYSF